MRDIVTIRASATPLAFRCPGSVRPVTVRVDDSNEAGAIGTAAHEALRPLVESGQIDWTGIERIAREHAVPVDEVRMLVASTAKHLWPTVKGSFPDALTEVALSAEIAPGVTLTGHVDLLSISGTVARAGDFKTGRKDSDYSDQMRSYGALIFADNPDLTEVTVTTLWVREAQVENYTLYPDDAKAWCQKLLHRVVDWNGVYHPGEHCMYCRRSHECEAANAQARRDIAAFADKSLLHRAECELGIMKPSDIVDLHAKADFVEKYAKRVTEAIRSHVIQHGPVKAKGISLEMATQRRRKLNTLQAWQVLESHGFADEDFADCADISISRVEKRIANKAGRGKGAAAVRALNEDLEKAKALRLDEREILTRKRV